jgi:hypothetical protein
LVINERVAAIGQFFEMVYEPFPWGSPFPLAGRQFIS